MMGAKVSVSLLSESAKTVAVSVPVKKNNILIFTLDDVGVDMIPAWLLDSPLSPSFTAHPIMTNIGAMTTHANGMRMRRFSVNPSCSPTRAMFTLGRYPFRTGTGIVINELNGGEIPTSEAMICRLLESAGYDNAYVGKWHLSQPTIAMLPGTEGAGTGWEHPTAHGWRIFRGTFSNLDRAPTAPESGGFKPGHYNFYYHDSLAGGPETQQQVVGQYSVTHTTETAADTIISHLREPWICFVNFNAPHSPFGPPTGGQSFSGCMPPEEITHSPPGTYDPDITNTNRAVWDSFRASLEAIDHQIGVMLDTLESSLSGINSRTNVFVMGENGTPLAIWSSAVALGVPNLGTIPTLVSQGRFKATVYEAGIRCPLVMRGPDVRGGPKTNRRMIDATDLFETARNLGLGSRDGVLPASRVVDGVSFASIARNSSASALDAHERTYTLAEMWSPNGLPGTASNVSISFRRVASDGKTYSLVRHAGEPDEFYQLYSAAPPNNVDPWQQDDLGDTHPMYAETVAALEAKLAEDG